MRSIETFVMPEKIESLNKKEADAYFKTFLTTAPFLEQEVIGPIRSALKKKTGYSDAKKPEQDVIEQEFCVGETKFIVKTILTDKRPQYSSIITSLYDYMYFSEEHARLGIKRDDLLFDKKNGKSYLRADILVGIASKMKERITEKGIKQEIYYDILKEIPDKIAVPITDYRKLPPEAAKLPEFEAFYKESASRTIKQFEKLLKKGIREEGWKDIDNYLFHVCKIPSISTEYAKIYETLIFQKKEKSKKKVNEGELVLIADNRHKELKKSIINVYEIIKKGKNYVSIRGLAKRLEQLTEEYTREKNPATKLFFYPFV